MIMNMEYLLSLGDRLSRLDRDKINCREALLTVATDLIGGPRVFDPWGLQSLAHPRPGRVIRARGLPSIRPLVTRPEGAPMDTSRTPPDDVTDADWADQNSSTDPFEEFDAAPTVPVQRSMTEADPADVAEQAAVVPLIDDEE
jgi:hypothetical protein